MIDGGGGNGRDGAGRLSVAFSPCPNDTFVFDAWVNGRLVGAPAVQVTYADVDVTNTAAERGDFDVVKVSYAALPWLVDQYELLPCGGALGRGCGPLVLTRGDRDRLDGATIAVPGERTTAYLLMRLWGQGIDPALIEILPFHQIMPAVRDGRVDAGLVIHEARFTYPDYGLVELADLGRWWEQDTGLPIPLGAILARRDLAERTGVTPALVTKVLRRSVRHAWDHPAESTAYVGAHAQEMDPAVQRRHIDLYVNEYTEDLGSTGYAAVRALLARAHDAGLTPAVPAV